MVYFIDWDAAGTDLIVRAGMDGRYCWGRGADREKALLDLVQRQAGWLRERELAAESAYTVASKDERRG